MSPQITCLLIASAGAFCQEILHWYNLRNKILDVEVQQLAKSKWYWIITIVVIITSGFGTYFLFFNDISDKFSVQFILGAAFPNLFKKIVETRTNEGHHLGDSKVSFSEVAKLYFK